MSGNREPGNKNSGEQTGEYDAWEEVARQAADAWRSRMAAENGVTSGATGAEAGVGEIVTPGEAGGGRINGWSDLSRLETDGVVEAEAGKGDERLKAWEERMSLGTDELWGQLRQGYCESKGRDIGGASELEAAAGIAEGFFEQRFPGIDGGTKLARTQMALKLFETKMADGLAKIAGTEKDTPEMRREIARDAAIGEKLVLERLYVNDPSLTMGATASGDKLTEDEKIAWALASEIQKPGQLNLLQLRENYPRREGETPDNYIQRIENYSKQNLAREEQLRMDKATGMDRRDVELRRERAERKAEFLRENPEWGKVKAKEPGEDGYAFHIAAERLMKGEREGKVKNVFNKLRGRLGFMKVVGKVMAGLGRKMTALGEALAGEEVGIEAEPVAMMPEVETSRMERPVVIHRSEYATERGNAGNEAAGAVQDNVAAEASQNESGQGVAVETSQNKALQNAATEAAPRSLQGAQAEQVKQGEAERGTETGAQMGAEIMEGDRAAKPEAGAGVDGTEIAGADAKAQSVKPETIEVAEEEEKIQMVPMWGNAVAAWDYAAETDGGEGMQGAVEADGEAAQEGAEAGAEPEIVARENIEIKGVRDWVKEYKQADAAGRLRILRIASEEEAKLVQVYTKDLAQIPATDEVSRKTLLAKIDRHMGLWERVNRQIEEQTRAEDEERRRAWQEWVARGGFDKDEEDDNRALGLV